MSTPFSPLARMIARLCVIMLVLCSAGSAGSAVAQDQAPEQKAKFTRRPAPKGKPVVYSKTLAPASPALTAPAAHPTRPVRPARVHDADNMAAPASPAEAPRVGVPAEAPRVGVAPLKATPAPATRKPAPPVRKRTVDPVGTEAPAVPAPPAEPQR